MITAALFRSLLNRVNNPLLHTQNVTLLGEQGMGCFQNGPNTSTHVLVALAFQQALQVCMFTVVG